MSVTRRRIAADRKLTDRLGSSGFLSFKRRWLPSACASLRRWRTDAPEPKRFRPLFRCEIGAERHYHLKPPPKHKQWGAAVHSRDSHLPTSDRRLGFPHTDSMPTIERCRRLRRPENASWPQLLRIVGCAKSTHIDGTLVPAEEPSTASQPDLDGLPSRQPRDALTPSQ